MKKHSNRPERKPKPRPELGSSAYFDQMPAAQAREELKITYRNYQRVQRQLSDLRAGLHSFKALLEDV